MKTETKSLAERAAVKRLICLFNNVILLEILMKVYVSTKRNRKHVLCREIEVIKL